MEEMKRLLAQYQTIFILGTNGSERYEFFRSYIDKPYQAYLPRGEFITTLPYPIILFPDDHYEGFIERQNSFLPLSSYLGEGDIDCLYIPIKSHKLPSGFVYILPPSLGKKDFDVIEDHFSFHDQLWVKRVSKMIWMEGFPYGQRDGKKVLEFFKRSQTLNKVDLSVCFLKSGRKFGYSDLSTEEKAIAHATELYIANDLCRNVFVIDPSEKERQFTDVIYTRISYKHLVLSRVRNEITSEYEDFKDFFDEDYEFLVLDKLSIEKLDEVFSYKHSMKANNQNLVAYWINQIDEEIISVWRSLFKEMINEYITKVDIMDRSTEIDQFLKKQWNAKMKLLKKHYTFQVKVSSNMDEISYLVHIKHTKVAMKQEIVKFLFDEMATSIKEVLESRFAYWKKTLNN